LSTLSPGAVFFKLTPPQFRDKLLPIPGGTKIAAVQRRSRLWHWSPAAGPAQRWLSVAMTTTLKEELKRMMVANLMLQVRPDEIADDLLLFGPASLGLDSVDALQLVVALDKEYGLKIPDPNAARQILQSVNSIAIAIDSHRHALAANAEFPANPA
jgi:acyl carrier protein